MMMKGYSFALNITVFWLSVLGTVNKTNAQFTMYLDSVKNVCSTDSTVKVSLKTKNFKGILEVQGAVKWNPSVLQFVSFDFGANNPIQLDSSMVNVDSVNGYILIAWVNADILVPVTLPNATSLFSINLKIKTTLGGNTNLKFTSYPAVTNAIAPPLPSQIVDSSLKVRTDTSFIPGFVSFIIPPAVVQNGTSLSAVASGSPISYQWNLAGNPIAGETSVTYANPGVVGGNYTVTAYYPNGCAETSNSIILPILLKDFNGYYKTGKAQLFWTSTNEINAAYFTIERSFDGKRFVAIDKVTASNNKSGAKYSYADIITSLIDKVYYRLQITDKDGLAAYSNVLSFGDNSTSYLSIYPNPVHDNLSLHIQGNKTENIVVKVTDMSGRVVVQKPISLGSGLNNFSINVSSLAKGNYMIEVKGSTQQQQMFMKY